MGSILPNKRALMPEHREQLHESAISNEVIKARGYRSIKYSNPDNAKYLKSLRLPGWAITLKPKDDVGPRYPGLLIPLYRATGEQISWQYKADVTYVDPATGKPRKYASPVDQRSVADVHPFNFENISDITVPLWITEGVKKADALTSLGLCAIALSGVYNWRNKLGTLGDWEDIPIKKREIWIVFDSDAATNPNVAMAMRRFGEWLDSKGASKVHYIVVPGDPDGVKVGVDDFLASGGTISDLEKVSTPNPPRPRRNLRDTFTDARLAETLVAEEFIDQFRWASSIGWLHYDGTRWRPVTEKVPIEVTRQFVLEQYAQAVKAGNDVAIEGWHRATSVSKIRAVTSLAAGIDGVLSDLTEFDACHDFLNTPNGMVDLRTKELLPHDPDKMFTRITRVGYYPNARHKDWTAALSALPASIRPWMQIRFGQAITGYMAPDDRVVIQQGGGDNGKTTITIGISKTLGDTANGGYYVLVPDKALLGSPSDHTTELMTLRGARFAVIEETPEAHRLDSQKLKKVTSPQITARLIRKDNVTFDVTHSLFVSSNYRPIVEETDHGTWRRLVLVVYPYKFVPEEEGVKKNSNERPQDPGLRQRIKSGTDGQHEAILAWLVEGASKWYANDQQIPELPERVRKATKAWRKEADLVEAYIDDRIEFEQGRHVMSMDLMDDFNNWLQDRGHVRWSERLFISRLTKHELVENNRVKEGLRRYVSEENCEGLSRPEDMRGYKLPKRYRPWFGIRFAEEMPQKEISKQVREVKQKEEE